MGWIRLVFLGKGEEDGGMLSWDLRDRILDSLI